MEATRIFENDSSVLKRQKTKTTAFNMEIHSKNRVFKPKKKKSGGRQNRDKLQRVQIRVGWLPSSEMRFCTSKRIKGESHL